MSSAVKATKVPSLWNCERSPRSLVNALCTRRSPSMHIPLIRRQDVKGFVQRTPVWLVRPLGLDTVRKRASAIEVETRRFYERAATRAQDASIRQLLDDLAQEERLHEDRAQELTEAKLRPDVEEDEVKARRRLFVLQIVQPGLAGLMDGSVSTLVPVFAAALATKNSWDAFLVGMAASLGAGISMGFAEALSDDGSLTGRGHPWARGLICGAMTTLGGIGHTLPFVIKEFQFAFGDCNCRRPCRTRGHHMGATPVHGYASVLRSSAGGTWRSTRVHYGHPYRKIVRTVRANHWRHGMILSERSISNGTRRRGLARERKKTLGRGSDPIYSRYRRAPGRQSNDFSARASAAYRQGPPRLSVRSIPSRNPSHQLEL